MGTVPRRAERLRKVARKLTEQYGLPWERPIEAEIDAYARPKQWVLSWQDGPTEGQVRRAAAKLDKEALAGVGFRREYSDLAYAVAAIRFLQEQEPENAFQAHVRVGFYDARRALEAVKSPGPSDARERYMAERLVAAAEGRSTAFGDGDAICHQATEKGLSVLLRGEDGPELSPVEVLTERYAQGRASALWRHRLIPMTALEAFAAAQADTNAAPEHVAAALSLVPSLHVELDAAAEALRERSTAGSR
ncbi:hypothetical protein ACWGIR_30900 [Streptomyces albidoflavus]